MLILITSILQGGSPQKLFTCARFQSLIQDPSSWSAPGSFRAQLHSPVRGPGPGSFWKATSRCHKGQSVDRCLCGVFLGVEGWSVALHVSPRSPARITSHMTAVTSGWASGQMQVFGPESTHVLLRHGRNGCIESHGVPFAPSISTTVGFVFALGGNGFGPKVDHTYSSRDRNKWLDLLKSVLLGWSQGLNLLRHTFVLGRRCALTQDGLRLYRRFCHSACTTV